MDKEQVHPAEVEDVTIEELVELAGADCAGTAGTASSAGTPASTLLTVGTFDCN